MRTENMWKTMPKLKKKRMHDNCTCSGNFQKSVCQLRSFFCILGEPILSTVIWLLVRLHLVSTTKNAGEWIIKSIKFHHRIHHDGLILLDVNYMLLWEVISFTINGWALTPIVKNLLLRPRQGLDFHPPVSLNPRPSLSKERNKIKCLLYGSTKIKQSAFCVG